MLKLFFFSLNLKFYRIFMLNNTLQQLIDLAILEDLSSNSLCVTTKLFNFTNTIVKAKIISKQKNIITLCGIDIINPVLDTIAKKINCKTNYHIKKYFNDTDKVQTGDIICEITATKDLLLISERIILNFLQYLSAIATKTATFVTLLKNTNTKILDTRKTLPAYRYLAKYAVRCGGGYNHRMGLYDMILIKDNHIATSSIKSIVTKLIANNTKLPIIIEINTQQQLQELLSLNLNDKFSRILLDNMNIAELKQAVKYIKKTQVNLTTEASGNIDINNILAIANTGVDFISMGCLTHSVETIDLSLKIY